MGGLDYSFRATPDGRRVELTLASPALLLDRFFRVRGGLELLRFPDAGARSDAACTLCLVLIFLLCAVSQCRDVGIAALVVCNFPQLDVVYEDYEQADTTVPYVPGFLAFREVPAYLLLLQRVVATPFAPQVCVYVHVRLHPSLGRRLVAGISAL